MAVTIILSDAQAEGLGELLDLVDRGREDFLCRAQAGDYAQGDIDAAEQRWAATLRTAEALRTQQSSAIGARHPLFDAVEEWAHCADQITDGNPWTGFNCGETETLAAVLRAAGHEDTAAFVVRMHREDDDEGDGESH